MLLFAATADAAPLQYQFTAGSADIYVIDTVTGQSVMVDAAGNPMAFTTVILDGAEVMLDPVGGAGALTSLDFTTTGPWVMDLDASLSGGFDQVVVDLSQLTASGGDLTSLGGIFYDYTIGPVTVDSFFSATNPSAGINVTNQFLRVLNPLATGTLSADASHLGQLTMPGMTLGQLTSPLSGRQTTVVANFVWNGARPIPEPHAALLFGIGAVVVGAATRKRRE